MNEAVRRTRVGALIAIAAIGLAATLIAIKGAAGLLGGTVRLEAAFENVSGLVPGAAVRLAGMQVGQVEEVYLPPDTYQVVVKMSVDEAYLERIREDSVATITTRGLLGDPLIEISLGSRDAAPVEDGDRLKSEGPKGVKQMLSAFEKSATNIEEASTIIRDRVDTVLSDELAKDMQRIAHSTARILEGVEKGPGLAHDLVYGKELSSEARRTIRTARRAFVRLDRAAESTERILAEVERGDGFLHAAIYDERAGDALAELTGAIRQVEQLLGDVREGADGETIGEDLQVAAQTLRKVMEEIDQGKGTIGALIKDPTVYEDLKQVLSKVRRNTILKSIVRMTIAKDELERE